MEKMDLCINCSEDIPFGTKICPYCGFDEEEYMKGFDLHKFLKPKKEKKKKKPMFTNAEALSMGIYPKDEAYKMSIMAQMYDEE